LFGLEKATTINYQNEYKAKFSFDVHKPDEWGIELNNGAIGGFSKFVFYAPQRMKSIWRNSDYDKVKALNIKSEFFSRVFVFPNKYFVNDMPFIIIKLDKEWLENQR
jgi:hypothetical protein